MRILWVSLLIVLLDQATKIAVVQMMHRGESIPVIGDWFKLTFTENPGMAFGMEIFSRQSMALVAIFVTVLLFWYLFSVRGGYKPYVGSLAMVLGGAIGNVIDRSFYGVFLNYGGLLEGKVVDFIHFDVWRGYLPDSLPWIGGSYLPLFPIWNVADMAIVVGVVGILIFQRRFHQRAFGRQPAPGAGTASSPSDAKSEDDLHPSPDANKSSSGSFAPSKSQTAADIATPANGRVMPGDETSKTSTTEGYAPETTTPPGGSSPGDTSVGQARDRADDPATAASGDDAAEDHSSRASSSGSA